ncbi:MAG: hypothetical protein J3K34DRAFT_226879 [Monoraphidium minutum]|nr:MAG: hypothetical protein J3K34DRAFT_226879 [Monoraphidium minutum]
MSERVEARGPSDLRGARPWGRGIPFPRSRRGGREQGAGGSRGSPRVKSSRGPTQGHRDGGEMGFMTYPRHISALRRAKRGSGVRRHAAKSEDTGRRRPNSRAVIVPRRVGRCFLSTNDDDTTRGAAGGCWTGMYGPGGRRRRPRGARVGRGPHACARQRGAAPRPHDQRTPPWVAAGTMPLSSHRGLAQTLFRGRGRAPGAPHEHAGAPGARRLTLGRGAHTHMMWAGGARRRTGLGQAVGRAAWRGCAVPRY